MESDRSLPTDSAAVCHTTAQMVPDLIRTISIVVFRELKHNGTLNKYVLNQQTKISDRLTALEHQGLQPHEAEEMVRDQM